MMDRLCFWLVFLFVLSLVRRSDEARILGILTTSSHSHHLFNRVFMLELVKRGHHVTVFSPDPEKEPIANYRDIHSERGYEGLRETEQFEDFAEFSHWDVAIQLFHYGVMGCGNSIDSKGGRQLLELTKNETFDLIIAEVMIQECMLGFVHKFGNPPLIGITAFGSPPWANEIMGNFLNPAYVNTYTLQMTPPMTFFQRVQNFVFDTAVSLYRKYVYMPQQDEIGRKFFGDAVPLPSEIEKRFQFVMVNSHFSVDYPRPLVPGIIEIGGMQVKPSEPLPKELKHFMDSSTEGVIYMNLGTNIRSDMLKDYQLRAFLDAFAELPYKVLWKFEKDNLPGKPPNVKIMKWIPQNDILPHPNLKVFLGHGGLMGSMETVYHGVPMVGVPFMLDQAMNVHKLISHGMAVELDPLKLTKQAVLDALNKVLSDTSYKERAKRLSTLFWDRPQTPLETAVWWTEYALRHSGAPHLHCASLDLAWYQRWLLDLLTFLLLFAAALCGVVYAAVKFIKSRLVTKKHKLKRK